MRRFTYEVFISEDEGGYNITDAASPEYQKCREGEQYIDHPGLHLTIKKCSDIDAFLNKFCLGYGSVSGKGFEQFQAAYYSFNDQFRDIMLGKNVDWKLIDVYVRNYEFRLIFLNERLHEAYFKNPELIKRNQEGEYFSHDIDSLLPYLKGVEIKVRRVGKVNFPATEILIEETNPHNDVISKTRIILSEAGSAKAIEEGSESGRIIDFCNKDYFDNDTPAFITEYSW